MVSLIIPVYNVAPYIEHCLSSIIKQTYHNMEVLLIDDCGIDNSMALVLQMLGGKENTEINGVQYNVIRHTHNRGLSAARNTGIKEAKGEYICFMDSDDYSDPVMVETLVNAMESSAEDVGIVSSFFLYDNNGKIEKPTSYKITEQKIIEPQKFVDDFLNMDQVPHMAWAKLYKKEIFEHTLYREGRNVEDRLFILDVYPFIEQKQIKTLVIPEYLYYYRFRSDSICHTHKKPVFLDDIMIMEEVMTKVKNDHPSLYLSEKKRYAHLLFKSISELATVYRNRLSLFYKYCLKWWNFSNKEAKVMLGSNAYKPYLKMKYLPFLYRFQTQRVFNNQRFHE